MPDWVYQKIIPNYPRNELMTHKHCADTSNQLFPNLNCVCSFQTSKPDT